MVSDDTVKIYGKKDIKAVLSKYLMEAGIMVYELADKEQTLEEYFMSITGGNGND